jgi:hypothetical protein
LSKIRGIYISLLKKEDFDWRVLKKGRKFGFEGFYDSPSAGPVDSLGIQGTLGRLERFQGAVDGSNPGFFPFGDLG